MSPEKRDALVQERTVREAVARAADVLNEGKIELVDEVRAAVTNVVPALGTDSVLAEILSASVQQNVGQLIDGLRLGVSLDVVSPPNAMREYTRRLAQRDEGRPLLGFAFAKGHQRILRRAFEALHSLPISKETLAAATLAILEETSKYSSRLTEESLAVYRTARAERIEDRGLLTSRAVRALLRAEPGVPIDTGGLQGYRMEQDHLAVVLWSTADEEVETPVRLRDAASRITAAAGSMLRPLYVSQDAATAWCWIPVTNVEVQWEAIARALDDAGPDVWAAIGNSGSGVAGFRRSHRQAQLARDVALAPEAPHARVTRFQEVALISPMTQDLESAKCWVSGVLGDLATDDERHAILRETARVFLDSNGSYAAVAARLHLHRNTAQYRIGKAEEALGRPLREARLDVEMALAACRWLGRAVLATPDSEEEAS